MNKKSFNGVNPALPSFRRVLSALPRSARNEDSLMLQMYWTQTLPAYFLFVPG